jgi:hypothetical protein
MEQRASEDQVVPDSGPLALDSLVGATIVIRSEKVISAYRIVSNVLQAENATAEMLSTVVKALPHALKSCADIVSHGWDPVSTVNTRAGRK